MNHQIVKNALFSNVKEPFEKFPDLVPETDSFQN